MNIIERFQRLGTTSKRKITQIFIASFRNLTLFAHRFHNFTHRTQSFAHRSHKSYSCNTHNLHIRVGRGVRDQKVLSKEERNWKCFKEGRLKWAVEVWIRLEWIREDSEKKIGAE